METKSLTADEINLLKEELSNADRGRQREMRKGAIIALISLIVGLTFLFLNAGRTGNIAALISVPVLIYGVFNFVAWSLASKSIHSLKKDIDKGVKVVDVTSISGYNFFTKKLNLENGVAIERFEVTGSWKKGDKVYLERLPNSNFILQSELRN